MLLNLSHLSPETLQDQLVRQLRALILAGDLGSGAELPSIRSLAKEQKVSVITVQRSYETLVRDGLILAHPGRGFSVAPLADGQREGLVADRLRHQIAPLLRQARAEGLDEAAILRIVGETLRGDRS